MKICTLGDMKNNILQNVVSLNYQLLHVYWRLIVASFFVVWCHAWYGFFWSHSKPRNAYIKAIQTI